MQASLTLHPITQFSGISPFQVHPQHELLECLDKIIQTADQVKEIVYKRLFSDQKIVDAIPDPVFTLKSDSTKLGEYHEVMTDYFLQNISSATAPYLPPEGKGYFYALKYLEEEVLTNDIGVFNPEKLLKLVKIVNGLVCENFGPSVYRKKPIIIWDLRVFPTERNAASFKTLDKVMKENASSNEFKIWNPTLRAKVWKMEFAKERAIQSFTEEEYNALKIIAEIPPSYLEVPELMDQFVAEFAEKLSKEEDTGLLMAWTHEKIAQIHPFVDGNGRTARLMMSCVGMLRGKSPLLIDSDNNYTAAVSTRDYKKFAEYLKGLEVKQPRLSEFFDRCLRNLFENSCEALNIENLTKKFKAVKL